MDVALGAVGVAVCLMWGIGLGVVAGGCSVPGRVVSREWWYLVAEVAVAAFCIGGHISGTGRACARVVRGLVITQTAVLLWDCEPWLTPSSIACDASHATRLVATCHLLLVVVHLLHLIAKGSLEADTEDGTLGGTASLGPAWSYEPGVMPYRAF